MQFDIGVPTPFLLMLRPRSGAQQWIAREEYTLSPSVLASEFTDGHGNLCQRLTAPAGPFYLSTSADVLTADSVDELRGAPFSPIEQLPDGVLSFLLPSRYCESECFGQMATEFAADHAPGYDQVGAIVDWLRASVEFQPGSSQVPVSAAEVNQRKSGVCRDLYSGSRRCPTDGGEHQRGASTCGNNRRRQCLLPDAE